MGWWDFDSHLKPTQAKLRDFDQRHSQGASLKDPNQFAQDFMGAVEESYKKFWKAQFRKRMSEARKFEEMINLNKNYEIMLHAITPSHAVVKCAAAYKEWQSKLDATWAEMEASCAQGEAAFKADPHVNTLYTFMEQNTFAGWPLNQLESFKTICQDTSCSSRPHSRIHASEFPEDMFPLLGN